LRKVTESGQAPERVGVWNGGLWAKEITPREEWGGARQKKFPHLLQIRSDRGLEGDAPARPKVGGKRNKSQTCTRELVGLPQRPGVRTQECS